MLTIATVLPDIIIRHIITVTGTMRLAHGDFG